MRKAGLVLLVVVVLALAARSADAQCPSCPSQSVCGYINCTPCNSGSFCAMVVCHVTPGGGCACADGACNAGQCATCAQLSADGTICQAFVGCTGMMCPPYHCYSASAKQLAHMPCDQCATARLSGAGTSAEVSALRDPHIPVEVVAFEPATIATAGTLRVRNHGASPLVSLVSVLTYTGTNGSEANFTLLMDSWHLDYGSIAADTIGEVSMSTVVQSKTEAVAKVSVRPVYAEFEDGSRVGIQADTTHMCLKGYHVKKVEAMKAVLAAYKSNGEDGLRQALKERRKDLLWLEPVLERQGVPAVVTELTKERRLRP